MSVQGEQERTVRPSVLERLIDGGRGAEAASTWSGSVREYREAVLRDLEWLLNTRRTPEPVPDAFQEVRRSVYRYGIPDVTSLSADSPESSRVLMRNVAECIEMFEPRLTDVRVTIPDRRDPGSRRMRFTVEALLRMEPNPERILFDTVLETASGKFLVTGFGDA